MNNPIIITLTEMEMKFADVLGEERHRRSVARGSVDRWGGDHGADEDRLGVGGEMAFCKWAHIYFVPTIDTFKKADAMRRFQIRARSRHDYELFVRSVDANDEAFVLLTSQEPSKFWLRGWLPGAEAKRPEWLKDHGNKGQPAYFVPREHIRPISTLRQHIDADRQKLLAIEAARNDGDNAYARRRG